MFLILVHKLEYFLNARILGRRIDANTWEMILVMAGLKAIAGLPGLVLVPVLYAYVKSELRRAGLIGRAPEAASQDVPPSTNQAMRILAAAGEGLRQTWAGRTVQDA